MGVEHPPRPGRTFFLARESCALFLLAALRSSFLLCIDRSKSVPSPYSSTPPVRGRPVTNEREASAPP